MQALLAEIGLAKCPPFHRDALFWLALAAGAIFWIVLALALARRDHHEAGWTVIASLTLWQPAVEELLFRGVLQGELLRRPWGRGSRLGISCANAIVSVVFTALHFLYHPAIWAASVIFPSLLFGFFRERHASVYPPAALHIYYNTGYFLTVGFV
jgi:uncharacterized protein